MLLDFGDFVNGLTSLWDLVKVLLMAIVFYFLTLRVAKFLFLFRR